MSLRTLRILLIAVGIAFVVLTAWSLRFFGRYQPLAALTQNYTQPGLGQIGLQANDVLVVGHEAGRRHWRMAARTVTFSRDRRALDVIAIRQGLLYDQKTRPLISLTAGHASYQTPFGTIGGVNTGTLRMDGGILATVLTPDKPILQTQALVWDALRDQLISPGPLTAALPRLSVTAGNAAYAPPPGGMEAAAQGTLTLGGGVRAVLRNARGQATLNCPGLTWNGTQSLARSLGPVTAQIPGNLGTVMASDIQVDTKTGNLTGHGIHGTMALSGVVL